MSKGFTLVELLAVIVILAIIGAIGVVSYTSITEKSQSDYYENLIDNLELGATNYFIENRSKRPSIGEKCAKVNVNLLIDEKFIENVNDVNGDSCDLENSYVYIKRNDNNKQYEYKVSLICNNYENIINEDDYCQN